MKCPIDQREMEIGVLTQNANTWEAGKHDFKISGNPIFVHAYKCPKCGKVELTTEVK